MCGGVVVSCWKAYTACPALRFRFTTDGVSCVHRRLQAACRSPRRVLRSLVAAFLLLCDVGWADMFFTVYLYAQMLTNLVMAVNTVDCDENNEAFCQPVFFADKSGSSFQVFAGSQCISQFMAALMFSRGRQVLVAHRWSLLFVASVVLL